MGVYLRKGEDGSKVWYVRYKFGGRIIRKSTKGASRSIAEKMLGEIKTEIIEGRHEIKKQEKMLFRDFARHYLDNYAVAKPGYDTEKRKVEKIIVPFLGDMYLDQITELTIIKFKRERKMKCCSATVNRDLALLRYMFNIAKKEKRIRENPLSRSPLFEKEDNQRVRYLERGEIQILQDSCEPFLRPIVQVALSTGLRQAKILGLKWDDIDMIKGFMTVRKNKNKKTMTVPINTELKQVLETHKRTCNLDSPFLFCDNGGRPYKRFGIFRGAWERALGKAGIKDFRFHDLRHTTASHLVMKGANILDVKEFLGHDTLSMTLRYAHLSPDFKRSTAELLQFGYGQNNGDSVGGTRSAGVSTEETAVLVKVLNK